MNTLLRKNRAHLSLYKFNSRNVHYNAAAGYHVMYKLKIDVDS